MTSFPFRVVTYGGKTRQQPTYDRITDTARKQFADLAAARQWGRGVAPNFNIYEWRGEWIHIPQNAI